MPQLKKPRTSGVFCGPDQSAASVFRDNRRCIERIVDAGTEDMVVEADISLIQGPGEVGLRSEIEIEVFQLTRPVSRKLALDTGAHGPADAGVAARCRCAGQNERRAYRRRSAETRREDLDRCRCLRAILEFANCEAASRVKQGLRIRQNTSATAEGGEPLQIVR